MTEPSSNPAEAAAPQPGPPPADQAPPAYQPGPAPASVAEAPPAYQPPTPGGYPTAYPGQPAYPVSAVPASAMPVSAYPTFYYAPPTRARVSPWVWILATVSSVLLLAAGGLGAAYLGAQNRVSELEQTITIVEEDLDDARADLEDAQACLDAFDEWWSAPAGQDDDEWAAAISACR